MKQRYPKVVIDQAKDWTNKVKRGAVTRFVWRKGLIAPHLKVIKPAVHYSFEEGLALALKDAPLMARRHWNVCVHEATHAVEFHRQGIRVGEAVVREWKKNWEYSGFVRQDWRGLQPAAPMSVDVAGHLGETLWGLDGVLPFDEIGSGAGEDFVNVRNQIKDDVYKRATPGDTAKAKRVWREETRKLRAAIRKDKLYGRRVLAVAKALSLAPKGRLDGDQIEKILAGVR